MLTSVGVLVATAEGGGGGAGAVPVEVWAIFLTLLAVMLLIDLKVVMREPHAGSTREAVVHSAVWIAFGVAFAGVLWVWLGGTAAQQYIAGYLIETSLSVDNTFVWAALFGYFAVPAKHQHSVLFWGVFAAILFRLAFIFAGVALLAAVSWIVFVFGAFLLYTAFTLFTHEDVEIDPEHNPVLVRIRRWIPHTEDYRGDRFVVRERGRYVGTPLLTVLVSIEFTDVLFAVDSVPAVLAITTNEFIAFSSNAFAILGLRAMYFLLAGLQDRPAYLNGGLGLILGFVGATFIAEGVGIQVSTSVSLGVIAVVLALTSWLSWRRHPWRLADVAEQPDGAGRPPTAGADPVGD